MLFFTCMHVTVYLSRRGHSLSLTRTHAYIDNYNYLLCKCIYIYIEYVEVEGSKESEVQA